MDATRRTLSDADSPTNHLLSVQSSEVFDVLTLLQSMEMLKDVGNNPANPTTLFVTHGPSAVMELKEQLKYGHDGNK